MSDDYLDGLDIGYCLRCGKDMRGEPPAAVVCDECCEDKEL